ncbi:MAG: 50S ribosomal protein L7/L12 [Candidatus Omnitrophica bacterium]|nr:50S ribosomal protein L7/L12 [Candidatus Omnitrophota bacterium]
MSEEKKVEAKQVEVKEQKEDTSKKDKPEVKLSKQAQDVVKTVEGMSVLELSNLVKALEDKFEVSASMPVMAVAAMPGAAGAGAAAAEEEKTSFTAELTKVGANKIQVIKEIRTITSLGLKEAKDLVDSAPKPIKEGVNKEEAEEIKKKLTAVGATVELK